MLHFQKKKVHFAQFPLRFWLNQFANCLPKIFVYAGLIKFKTI